MPARLAGFLPESGKPRRREIVGKLQGKQPPSVSKNVEHTVETIWQLAAGGCVILVGRGANVITAKLKNVFHVRLVGSLENRVERVEEVYDFDRRAALEYIQALDAAKRLHLQDHFRQNIDDPAIYHLIVNTDRISYGDTAKLIGDAVLNCFKLETAAKTK